MALNSIPTYEVIDWLRGRKVVECGAGVGLWKCALEAMSVDVVALDPNPQGHGVINGTHKHLGQYSDRVLLIIWPPDGTDLNEWVKVWGGEDLMIVGNPARFTMPDNFALRLKAILPGGDKGDSTVWFGDIDRSQL